MIICYGMPIGHENIMLHYLPIKFIGAISNGTYVQTIHTHLNSKDKGTNVKLFYRSILPKSLTQLSASKKRVINDTDDSNGNVMANENSSFWKLPKLSFSNGMTKNSTANENPLSSSKVSKIPSISIFAKRIDGKANKGFFYFSLGSCQRLLGYWTSMIMTLKTQILLILMTISFFRQRGEHTIVCHSRRHSFFVRRQHGNTVLR